MERHWQIPTKQASLKLLLLRAALPMFLGCTLYVQTRHTIYAAGALQLV